MCAQDDVTMCYAPEDALCDEYVEDNIEARPCIALTRPATDVVVVKNGTPFSSRGDLSVGHRRDPGLSRSKRVRGLRFGP